MTTLETALIYIEKFGFHIVPIPFGSKAPVVDRWQQLEITTDNVGTYFNEPQNVGVRLGDPYNLTDVDLDTAEALWAWQEFQLETYFTFGHRSKPASHHFFFPDDQLRSRRYVDPAAKTGTKACLIEVRSRKSDGTYGLQTVAPPSVHESGEPIEFAGGFMGEPGKVIASDLQEAADLTAASALLGRYAPAEGTRHDYFLALAGALAHAKRPMKQALGVVRAVYRVIWKGKADLARAEKEVDSSYRRYDDGGEVTGLPNLNRMLDGRVYGKAVEWLKLKGTVREEAARRPRSFAQVHSESVAEMRAKVIPLPEQLIEDLLPRKGVTLVYGKQKSGKTIFAVQTAVAIASGKALFDYYRIKRPGGVLVCEQDDPDGRASIRQILDASRVPSEIPFWLIPRHEGLAIDHDLVEGLAKRIAQDRLVAIVLDSYTALRASQPHGVDIVKFESEQVSLLDRLGKEHDCLILLLHHISKGSDELDWDSQAGGTYGMLQALESQILIKRYKELDIAARERLIRMQARHMASRELAVRFDTDRLNYTMLLEGAGAPLYPDVLLIQTGFGGKPFTPKQAMEALGLARTACFAHLKALTQSQVLIRTLQGDYTLAAFAQKC